VLSVRDGWEDNKALRLRSKARLTATRYSPRDEIDHLAEAEAFFAQPQHQKVKAKARPQQKTASIKTKTQRRDRQETRS